jgi:hypothetical protein
MFASRKFTLDVAVATLAGLAVAFLAFAAPAGLLADMVGATGLASILPAAEPSLGMEARLGIGAGGAVLVFAAALLLLRRLDRFRARRAEEAEEAAAVLEAPRRRRRDIHPDAPARAPLLAGHEVGEPEPAPQIWAADAPDPFQESLRESRSKAEAVALSQRTWPEELPVGFAEPPKAPVEPVWEEAAETPQPWPLASVAREPEPGPAAVEAPPGHSPGSIPDLIERLEWGLARCRLAPAPQPAPAPVRVAAAEPEEPPARADDRLQSAILNLQRLASRQH